MSSFTAFLLDPAAETIRPVIIDHENVLAALYKLIDCQSVDRVWIDKTHLAYCDDEGMMAKVTGLWSIRDREQSPVAGRAVIVADDGEGGDATPTIAIMDMAARFRIFRPVILPELVTLEPISPGELGGAIVHATRVGGLRLALDRPALTVEAGR